jgi:hypothetical protein
MPVPSGVALSLQDRLRAFLALSFFETLAKNVRPDM